MCFQLANRFGSTFRPVFSLENSSSWALRSLFWMGQGKLGRGARKQEMRQHILLPMHNKQAGEDFCTYLVRASEKMHYLLNALFVIFVFVLLDF